MGSVSRQLRQSSKCKKCSKILPASEISFTGRKAVTPFRNMRLRRGGRQPRAADPVWSR
jgi:hypothetical protein